MLSWTKKRVGEMQTWPELRNLAMAAALALAFGSASRWTMTGAWPPSSIEARLMPSAHWASTFLPTATEPVSDTFRITGEAMSSAASFDDGPVMTVTTPGGTPASISAWARWKHDPGASEAGRATTAQPAASAAAIFRDGRSAGKFQAESDRQTPTGW